MALFLVVFIIKLQYSAALFSNTSIVSGDCFAEASCYAGNNPSTYYSNTIPQSSTQGCFSSYIFFKGNIGSTVCSNGAPGMGSKVLPYGNVQIVSKNPQNTIAANVTVDITFLNSQVLTFNGFFDYVLASALYGDYNNYPVSASALVFGLSSLQKNTADPHILPLGNGYSRYYNTFVIPGGTFYQYFFAITTTNALNMWYNISWTWKLSCTECPAGKYSPQPCPSSCLPCPSNTYNQLTGQTACLACPGTSVSGPGQLSCSAPCGSYWQDGAVITCPPDFFCPD